ncbi:phenylpyruvate tautomerase PptA (4-oxalocrotonate tautomerase family) [Paraburkholderia sp. GAS33]|jgi:phenylpyruvate tautomerase PptA (4-oxalocrotonate tautomerase family)|uniref:tautomerase family protein n=1 Tax=Paraburkholderia sp. GAS33 TaxID=3035130 RepID=UPI003D1F04CE
MPTYIVSAASDFLSESIRQSIAEKFTQDYAEITGGPAFLVQVIFNAIPKGSHFVGGKQLNADHIFVHGYTREGKTPDQKARMLESIVDTIAQAASVARRSVWAYLSELPYTRLVEYGHVAPEPGQDGAWLDTLPVEDAAFIRSIA